MARSHLKTNCNQELFIPEAVNLNSIYEFYIKSYSDL